MMDSVEAGWILGGLKFKTTVERIEAIHMGVVTRWGFLKKSVPFGNRNDHWQAVVSQMQSGDEFWEYDYTNKWGTKRGYALIRNGQVIGSYRTYAVHYSPIDEGL